MPLRTPISGRFTLRQATMMVQRTVSRGVAAPPNNASALTGLANLSFKDGSDAEGISLLKKAIEYAPKAFEPRYLLGSAYNRMGKYGEALKELMAARSLARNSRKSIINWRAHTADWAGLKTAAGRLRPSRHFPVTRRKMQRRSAQ